MQRLFKSSEDARDFVQFCRAVGAGQGHLVDTLNFAEMTRSPKAVALAKAAVDVGRLDDAGFTGSYAYVSAAEAFIQSLESLSAFDRIRPFARELPLRTQVFAASQASAGTVSEGTPKLVSEMSFQAGGLIPVKVAGLLVLSAELLKRADQVVFANELRAAIAKASNETFVAALIDMSTPSVTASSDFLADLAAALTQTSPHARARYFLLANANLVARLALASNPTTGERLYHELTVGGGNIAGVEVLPIDGALADDSTGASDLLLVDAQQLAVGADSLVVTSARHATVEMDDSPTNPPTNSTVFISLWQQNLSGLKAERLIAAKKIRDTAAVVISGASYFAVEE